MRQKVLQNKKSGEATWRRAIVEDFTDWAGSLRNWRSSERVEIRTVRRVAAAPLLPMGYVVNARRIADRRMILAGYRLADLLTRVTQNFG